MSVVRRRLGPDEADATLAAVVRASIEGASWSQARRLCQSGRVQLDGETISDPARRVAAGCELVVDPQAPGRPKTGSLPPEAVVHVDRDIVVVDKPAGLLTVPYAETDRDTLMHRTAMALRKVQGRGGPPLRVVQRLDKETSGVLVFARNRRAERALGEQLRRHDVSRRYLALALGEVARARHETQLVPDRGDGLRGSWRGRGRPPSTARNAITEVEPLTVFDVPASLRTAEPLIVTLVACRLHTGRQHQIRIHLAESGHPIVGEHVYVRDYTGGFVRGHEPGRSRVMLHAEHLGFVHPAHARHVAFTREPPADFLRLLDALRAGGARRCPP